MQDMMHSRRGFFAALAGAIAPLAAAWLPDRAAALVGSPLLSASPLRRPRSAPPPSVRPAGAGRHPDPRPGIDGSRVLRADEVDAEVADLYDAIREIPHVVDGVRCYCGCADLEGFYSLLSCYEASGMAQLCEICEAEGRLVTRLHGDGRSLDEIRAAIDRRFA